MQRRRALLLHRSHGRISDTICRFNRIATRTWRASKRSWTGRFSRFDTEWCGVGCRRLGFNGLLDLWDVVDSSHFDESNSICEQCIAFAIRHRDIFSLEATWSREAVDLLLVPFNQVVDDEVPLLSRDLRHAEASRFHLLHIGQHAFATSVLLQLLESDRLAELLAEFNVNHEPARLLFGPTHLRILNEIGIVFVECTQIRFGFFHDLCSLLVERQSSTLALLTHDSNDAWLSGPFPTASIEERKVAKFHVFHVFAGRRVAHTIPRLWSSFRAEVVNRELSVVLRLHRSMIQVKSAQDVLQFSHL